MPEIKLVQAVNLALARAMAEDATSSSSARTSLPRAASSAPPTGC